MAEIQIQERRGNPLWMWVLIALIVIAALVWFLMRRAGTDAAVTPGDSVGSMIVPGLPDVPAIATFDVAAGLPIAA